MRRKSGILFFGLLILLIISIGPIPVYGALEDGSQVLFDLSYEPTRIIPSDKVNVTCAVLGFFNTRFTDDFERVAIGANWTKISGEWSIENNILRQSQVDNLRLIFSGNSTWSDYIFKLKVKKIGSVENNLDIIFRKGLDNTLTNFLVFSLRNDGEIVAVYKGDGDSNWNTGWTNLEEKKFHHTADMWYNVLIQIYGDTLKIKIWNDGENEPPSWLFDFELDNTPYEKGYIGFSCGSQAAFDDIEVYEYKSNVLVEEIILWYNVNNGTLNQLSLNTADDVQYKATIPKQTGETKVSFYVEIVDDLGNRFNSETVTYFVEFLPPLPIPWPQTLLTISLIVIIIIVWFSFRKGYIGIEVIEPNS